MEWWQIVSILLASIVVGTGVGILLSYLISRFNQSRETTQLVEQIINEARNNLEREVEESARVVAEVEYKA